MEDILIQNYDIPKGTTIIANNWGLHNDTKYWDEPEKFKPQRFLTEDGKETIMKPESYVPFSYGEYLFNYFNNLIYFRLILYDGV